MSTAPFSLEPSEFSAPQPCRVLRAAARDTGPRRVRASRTGARLPLPAMLTRQVEGLPTETAREAPLPSLVLNFVLRTSSPESFPFFPAKVALGQPDKLKAKVTY